MPQTDGSITPLATGSSTPLRVSSTNPFRRQLVPQDEDLGERATSISKSIVENGPSNIGERSPVPMLAAPSAHGGPSTSTPGPTVDKGIPALPPRRVGTLNSAASLATPTTSTTSSTTHTVSPSSPSSPSISPPESLSRIFAPPSGPPPTHTRTLTPRRTLSPPPASSPIPRSQTPPPLPSRRTTARISSPSPPRAGRGRRLRSNSSETMRVLAEDLPPAYTPGPDTRHGERTVDIGPVRPYIRDDTAALEESLRRRRQMGNGSGIPGATRQQAWGYGSRGRGGMGHMGLSGLLIELLTAGGVRNSPGQPQHRPSLLDSPRGRAAVPLQSQWTGTPVLPQPTGGPYISRPPTGTPPVGTSSGNWGQYPGQRSTPHVPPPPVHPSSLQTRSSPPTYATLPEIQQPVARLTDSRPTAHATSGRPLLYDGRVLAYPLGYECHKCHNRGYRPLRGSAFRGTPSALVPGDPQRPCRKCWSRYSRRYEGSLVNADWEGNVNGTGGTNYQRPISDPPPILEPSALAPPPSPTHSRTPSIVSPLSGNQVMTNAPAVVPVPRHARRSSRGTVVVRPGDPRIGGRVCWKCNGTGEVIVFIFDRERCRVCGGVGRVI